MIKRGHPVKYPGITPTNLVYRNNIISNPLFVNVGVGDYHLQSSSPVINKGINVGLPYSGSAPDLGAYEYQ